MNTNRPGHAPHNATDGDVTRPAGFADTGQRVLPDVLEIDDLVEAALDVVTRCSLGAPGRYRRWAVAVDRTDWQGINPYGVADAANLFYTLNLLPRDEATRRGFVEVLRQMQSPDDGWFYETTHRVEHTTAHCIAALELFDALPAYPLHALSEQATVCGVVKRLESLDWVTSPWNSSHAGAGVFASLKLSRQLDVKAERAWESAYFQWLSGQFDPHTGLLRRGCLPGQHAEARPVHEHMAGTFHYLFNMESARVPLPYPAQLVDSCLAMHSEGCCPGLGRSLGFITIDWLYCLNRGVRQSGHRVAVAQCAMREVAASLVEFLRGLDHEQHRDFNDLHKLFGAFCALAEAQAALPGFLKTTQPMRLVLDRRPFV